MSREITVRGVIIGRRAIGEGSVRVSLYTDAFGLIEALAKSAREERSKLRAHLQEGSYGTFTLVQGIVSWRVTGVYATRNIYFVNQDDARREAAARVIATIRQFVRGEGSDPYFFSVLTKFFDALPHLADSEITDAECVTVLRLLSALGYVEAGNGNEQFLSVWYGRELLEKAARSRSALIRTINESISVSGL